MSTSFKDYLNEQLQNPAFKAEYEALEPEFAMIQAMIDAGSLISIDEIDKMRYNLTIRKGIEHGNDSSFGGPSKSLCRAI